MDAKLELSELDRQLWDLFVFGKRTLGYDQITKLHLGWFRALLENQFLLLLAPRGHLKSTVATTVYALWRLAQDSNQRILIVNETLNNARRLLNGIKQHITSNEQFRSRYGAWDMTASKWTEDSVEIPRSKFHKEPSLSAGGVLGNLVSLHNDLIILDDPVSDKNSYTPHQRAKFLNWFKSVILPALEPDGQLVVVGTRWHAQDLYGHILEDVGFKHWGKIAQAAEWKDADGKRQLLFPERFTPAKLDQLKGSMGTASYFCQMLNDVSGQEGSDFKAEWLRACRYTELPKDMAVYIGVDLATGKNDSESRSRFAYAVVGVPKGEKDTYVIDAQPSSVIFPEQVKTIKRICHIHKPFCVCIENNAYQESMLQVLRTDPETARLPLVGVPATGDKIRRLKSMAPLFESGNMRLPADLPDLEEELLRFPRTNDDLLDALWLALWGVQYRRTEPKITFTEDLA